MFLHTKWYLHSAEKKEEVKEPKVEEKIEIKEEEEVILPLPRKKKKKLNSSLLLDETVNED